MHIALSISAAALLSLGLLAQAADKPAEARAPVLLELFTSEGCSSCPPADRLLEYLDKTQPVNGADLIVLSEHVDYWNHLGWSDPYSSSLFTDRQRRYADRIAGGQVYTPQLVVDGEHAMVGNDREKVLQAIQESFAKPKPTLTITAVRDGSKAKVRVVAPEGKGDLYLVVASDHARSQVSRGENAGHDLTHVAVAYSVAHISRNGKEFETPVKADPARIVAFLRDPKTGFVLSSAQIRI